MLWGTRIVVPEKLKKRVLSIAHEGHPGIVAIKDRLRSKVWWAGIDKDAENFVKTCESSQIVQKTANISPLKPNALPDSSWECLAMDLLEPLPSGDFTFVIIDYYSKFYEIEIMQSITSTAIIDRLKHIFARYGYPNRLISDNGKQLVNEEMREYTSRCGIKLVHVAPHWPQANGEIERQNRSLLKRIKITQLERKDWKQEILDYLLMYRSSPQASTGVSPAELMFGRKIKTKMPELRGIRNNLDEAIRDRDAWKKLKSKERYDLRNNAKESELKLGDTVLLKTIKRDKLSPEYESVKYEVVDLAGDNVKIKNADEKMFKRNVAHVKKFNRAGPSESDEDVKIISEQNVKVKTESESQDDSVVATKSEPSADLNVTQSRPVRDRKLPNHLKDCIME
ncbi:uncharacterized protein K02A2.6-like [Temnothorax curvispinosus]|uniref:RNA-directed DNA polymerase n=1 Tax=Temnothorax curvispinosus TaxID=300111 RepID=A0A6J1RF26_9HYME|nr:uncharacterized protein K02A2.6-like [Temnothorax curvispinosus]